MFRPQKKHYALTAVLLLIIVAIYFQFFKGTAFDREVWLQSGGTDQEEFPRLEMADDLIRTQRLVGLTREQVLDLLGDLGNHGYHNNYDLVYWLGDERGFFSIDSEWLAIRLGTDNKVVECKIVRD